ncbi:MAG: hypothetical protein ABSE51_24175, partial [Terracidiphilus sp.]
RSRQRGDSVAVSCQYRTRRAHSGETSATMTSGTLCISFERKLMRHAQVSTTMNIYGNALMGAKREANSKVVRMALRSA